MSLELRILQRTLKKIGKVLSPGTLSIVLNPFPNKPWFLSVCCTSVFKTLQNEEIAHNEQFLPFPRYFLPIRRTLYYFYQTKICSLQTFSVWRVYNLSFWKGLI